MPLIISTCQDQFLSCFYTKAKEYTWKSCRESENNFDILKNIFLNKDQIRLDIYICAVQRIYSRSPEYIFTQSRVYMCAIYRKYICTVPGIYSRSAEYIFAQSRENIFAQSRVYIRAVQSIYLRRPELTPHVKLAAPPC